MERLEKLREFIKEQEFVGTRTFFEDPMATIYSKDGILVKYCLAWDYLEIFGLSHEEYNSLKDILDI